MMQIYVVSQFVQLSVGIATSIAFVRFQVQVVSIHVSIENALSMIASATQMANLLKIDKKSFFESKNW